MDMISLSDRKINSEETLEFLLPTLLMATDSNFPNWETIDYLKTK